MRMMHSLISCFCPTLVRNRFEIFLSKKKTILCILHLIWLHVTSGKRQVLIPHFHGSAHFAPTCQKWVLPHFSQKVNSNLKTIIYFSKTSKFSTLCCTACAPKRIFDFSILKWSITEFCKPTKRDVFCKIKQFLFVELFFYEEETLRKPNISTTKNAASIRKHTPCFKQRFHVFNEHRKRRCNIKHKQQHRTFCDTYNVQLLLLISLIHKYCRRLHIL